jgi:hypothetical protein
LSEARPTLDTVASAARVASVVEHRSESGFVLLLQLADRHFSDPDFEHALAVSLREKPTLIELWQTWSGDQRWTPSAYVEDTVTGWFDGGVATSGSILTEPPP